MRTSEFAVFERKILRRSSLRLAAALAIAAALMIGNQSYADQSRYRVVLEDVPGADEIEAGNIRAGLKILHAQLSQVEEKNSGDIWSTLCAAYIINISLAQAERACNKAVEIDATYHALNNRGVFRVYQGDLIRAREDFKHVLPLNMQTYMDRLKATNVRLVAANNFDLVNQLLVKRSFLLEQMPSE